MLEIHAHRSASTALASPMQGLMDGRIEETMTSVLDIRLKDKRKNKWILEDQGRNAGLEVAGQIEKIITDQS